MKMLKCSPILFGPRNIDNGDALRATYANDFLLSEFRNKNHEFICFNASKEQTLAPRWQEKMWCRVFIHHCEWTERERAKKIKTEGVKWSELKLLFAMD